MFVINPSSCQVKSQKVFDTYKSESNSLALVDYLQGIANGTVVLLATVDHPTAKLSPAVPRLIELGMDVSPIMTGGAVTFAAVLQKGNVPKMLFRADTSQQSTINAMIAGLHSDLC